MNGNFDFFTTINNNGDNADLTPFWEVAEAKHISNIIAWAEYKRASAESALCCAPDWFVEKWYDRLIADIDEAEAILADYL